MDTSECQPLFLDIQEFYEGLNMKLEQQVLLLLVERQALNEAREGERNVRAHYQSTLCGYTGYIFLSVVYVIALKNWNTFFYYWHVKIHMIFCVRSS